MHHRTNAKQLCFNPHRLIITSHGRKAFESDEPFFHDIVQSVPAFALIFGFRSWSCTIKLRYQGASW